MSVVLVTGGSGFIGSYCILQLLAAGHEVRATVRKLSREPDVRAMLRQGGAQPDAPLSFFAADLQNDAGWSDAVGGCDYVMHVASPLPRHIVKHEDEVIVPAREGALRVLRAARDAGVKRVVLTSSFAAIGYGHRERSAAFTEEDWTDPICDASAYVKSKTIAERAAWDFMAREGGNLELAAVNPVAVLGPVLGADFSASIYLVQRMLEGSMPGCPDVYFGIVDVRDVADLHVLAMTHPAANGQRFLAVSGDFMSMCEVARVLKVRMGEAGRGVRTWRIPNWLVRIAALRSAAARQLLPELGKKKNGTSAKASRLLGWSPRASEEAIFATAESLARFGLLRAAGK
jgi:nucleoside-diphosphate-sugar epimerase